MSKKQDMTALIHKYLTSQATSEERLFLEAWMLESDENREMFEEIKLIWDNSEEEPIEISASEMQEGLYQLEETIGNNIMKENQAKRNKYKNLALLVLLLIVSLSAFGFYIQYELFNKEVVVTGKGNILLPDSTEVFSNKSTTVSFRQTLWKRVSFLEGEAFFEVHRNERRPFIIQADNTTIKVLGTSFLVRAYPGEPILVSVLSGNVAVTCKDQYFEIQKGEKALITKNDEVKISESTDPNLLSWKSGELVFNHATIEEVLAELERMYDVEFDIENKDILSCSYKGTFDNLSLRETLDILSFSLHMSVDYIDNKTIRLSGQGGCK